ncbi:hypothetical protein [Photobacterium halotolerans]|uniref:Chemotaxis protein n=1 Tax=Photobacterium halotolerans TaxID=265726 RepID=A0A7X4WD04_9GAMM|nr:hypothetical protein [Photobacterium halotolerans]NAW66142.1 hypothetical protein [Photobacterium halotolerans]
MGKGGKSSSDVINNTTNTSGTSAISGDNLGVVISGVNGNVGNISVTDHGSVKAASEIAKAALQSNSDAMSQAVGLGSDALKSNERVVDQSLDFGRDALDGAFDFGKVALAENSAVSKNAMDNMRHNAEDTTAAIKQMAQQSGETARAALAMADGTAARSQTGSSGDMTKTVKYIAVAVGVSAVALAVAKGVSK